MECESARVTCRNTQDCVPPYLLLPPTTFLIVTELLVLGKNRKLFSSSQ